MRSFSALTDAGRARRLRRLAQQALAAWSLDGARLDLLSHDNNTVFRVRHHGLDAVLRVARPRDVEAWDAEGAWLEHLRAVLPVAVPLAQGWFEDPGVPEPRFLRLFPWLRGPLLIDHLDPASTRALGELLFLLHAEQPAVPAPPMREVFHFGGPCRLRTHPDVAPVRSQLLAANDRIQSVLDGLYAGSPPTRLLHADLHAWNVKITRAGLVPFDFEEVRRGLPVQDVAITLYYLEQASADPALEPSLLDGYSSGSGERFDPAMLTVLRAAHALALLNAVLELDDPAYRARRPALIRKLASAVERGLC